MTRRLNWVILEIRQSLRFKPMYNYTKQPIIIGETE